MRNNSHICQRARYNGVMWSNLPFLSVMAHGIVGAWDEIIPATLIGLTIALGIGLFLYGRRFQHAEEEQELGDPES